MTILGGRENRLYSITDFKPGWRVRLYLEKKEGARYPIVSPNGIEVFDGGKRLD